ncbi:MAG TPA: DUF6297 family protein [Cellulomonas sp.]|uniref:DUF6297 family protein n=1 Tax=Cellulomonas sp. TaxID=40001 RepID=UPI002E32391B|nr:DUF6297 family protein [Cellulomonas sp.]HEX5332318.1 DUF6297 family protein [Cellulomonas sp.]
MSDDAGLTDEVVGSGDPGSEVVLVGPAATGSFPTGRSIRRYTAAATNLRSGASVGELLGDVYYVVITTAIGIGMALGIAGQLRASLPAGEPATAGTSSLSLPGLVLVLVVGLAGVLLSLAGRLGPVGSAAAEATWWLGLPVDRRGLLRPSARRLPLLAAVVGAVVFGVLDGGLLGDHHGGQVVVAALAAGLASATLVLAASLAQTFDVRRGATSLVGDLVLAAAPVLAVLGVVLGWHPAGLPAIPVWSLAGLVVVVAGLAVVVDRRLHHIPSRSLRVSGSVASQAAGAVVSMDSRELGRALTDSAAAPRRRRSARFGLVRGPVSALISADAAVLLRSVRHLVQVVVAALVPVLVGAVPQLAGRLGFAIALVVAGSVAMTATGEGARRAEMSPILDRLLPLAAREVRRLRMAVPGIVMLVWSLVAFGAVGAWAGDLTSWLTLGVVSTPVWAGAAVRAAYRPAPDWGGALVSTPMGALPAGVTMVLARGPDVVVLGLVPVLIAVALGHVPSAVVIAQVAVSAIVFAVCSSTSTKSMMERMTDASGTAAPGATSAATGPQSRR